MKKKTNSIIAIVGLFLFSLIFLGCSQVDTITYSTFQNTSSEALAGGEYYTSPRLSPRIVHTYDSSAELYNIGISLKDDFVNGTGLIFNAFPVSGKIRYHIKVVRTNTFPLMISNTIQLPNATKFSLKDLNNSSKLVQLFNGIDTTNDIELRSGDLFQIAVFSGDTQKAFFGKETPVLSFFYLPSLLFSWKDLNAIRAYPSGHYTFANNIAFPDIDYDGFPNEGFHPIDNFSGVLDGNNKVLSKLGIYRYKDSMVGLFSEIKGGSVNNLTLYAPNIMGRDYVGIIAGKADNASIRNVNILEGGVGGSLHIGGFIGDGGNTVVAGTFSGEVIGQDSIGGLATGIGGKFEGILPHTVASDSVGGLVGSCRRCDITGRVYGAVEGRSRVGGLVGKMWQGNVKGYNSGVVKGNIAVGGLVGELHDADLTGYATQPIQLASSSPSSHAKYSDLFRSHNKKINNWKQYRDLPRSSARGKSAVYLLGRGYGDPTNPDGSSLIDSLQDNGGAFLGSLVGIAVGDSPRVVGYHVKSKRSSMNIRDGKLVWTKGVDLNLRAVGFVTKYNEGLIEIYKGENDTSSLSLRTLFEYPFTYVAPGSDRSPDKWPNLQSFGSAVSTIATEPVNSILSVRSRVLASHFGEKISTGLLAKQVKFYQGDAKKQFLKNYSNYIVAHALAKKRHFIENSAPKAKAHMSKSTKTIVVGLAVGIGTAIVGIFLPELLPELLPAEVMGGLFGGSAAATATAATEGTIVAAEAGVEGGVAGIESGIAASTALATAEGGGLAGSAMATTDITAAEISATTAGATAAVEGGTVAGEGTLEFLAEGLEEGSQIVTVAGNIRKLKKVVDFVRIAIEEVQRTKAIADALTKLMSIVDGTTPILTEIEDHVNSLVARKINLSLLKPMAIAGMVPEADMLNSAARSMRIYQEEHPTNRIPGLLQPYHPDPNVLKMSIPHDPNTFNGEGYTILKHPTYNGNNKGTATVPQMYIPDGGVNTKADNDFRSNFLKYIQGSQILRLDSATNYLDSENIKNIDNLLHYGSTNHNHTHSYDTTNFQNTDDLLHFHSGPGNHNSHHISKRASGNINPFAVNNNPNDPINNYVPSENFVTPAQKINSYFPSYAGLMTIFQSGIGNTSGLLNKMTKHFVLGNKYALQINWFPGRYLVARGDTKKSLVMFVYIYLHTDLSYNLNFGDKISKVLSKEIGQVGVVKAGIGGQLIFNHGVAIPLKFNTTEQKWKVHKPGIDYLEEIILRPLQANLVLNFNNLSSALGNLRNDGANYTGYPVPTRFRRLWQTLQGQVSVAQENGIQFRWDLSKHAAKAGKAMAANVSAVVLGNLAGAGLYKLMGGSSLSKASAAGELGAALSLGAALGLESISTSTVHPDRINAWVGGTLGLDTFFNTQFAYLDSVQARPAIPMERISRFNTAQNRVINEIYDFFADFNIQNNLENQSAGGNKFFANPATILLRLFMVKSFEIYGEGIYKPVTSIPEE